LHAGADRIDWSPDGSQILFRTQPLAGTSFGGNLYTIRPDGSDRRQLTHYNPYDTSAGALWNGSYSPDGGSIVFSTKDGAVGEERDLVDVFVMSADGTDVRPVTRELNWDGTPDWGPR
jgi:TolB protein